MNAGDKGKQLGGAGADQLGSPGGAIEQEVQVLPALLKSDMFYQCL